MSDGINPLGELSPQCFLADYWQQQPLVVRQAFPGFQTPISAEELAGLSCEAEVNSRIVIEQGGARPWQTIYGPMDEAVFRKLPDTHWSLLVNDVEKHVPELAWLLDCFRFIPEWCIDDLMVSYAPAGGSVGPHLDRYDVFILQGQGHRHWQIHTHEVAANNRVPDTDMDIQKDFQSEQDWLLAPGDLIYIPPGVSHYGMATDDCMSFSIGFRAPSHADLLQDFVGFISQGRPAEVNFSDPQLTLQPHPNEITTLTIDAVRDVLAKYLQADHPALSRWFGRFISDVKTDALADVAHPVADFAALTSGCELLLRHPASHFAFCRLGNAAVLFVDGEDYDVSIGFAEQLCVARQVNVQALTNATTAAEQQLLLHWVNTGKLRCCGFTVASPVAGMPSEFQLFHVRWEERKRELGAVRRAVFVEEQGVPESLEWDGQDADCFHVLVTDAGQQPVATGRMKPDGHIGRMAVLPACRGQGVGSAVLEALLVVARQQRYAEVFLHAQVSAIAFYRRHGFVVYGAEFMDAGIPHKSMRRQTGSETDR